MEVTDEIERQIRLRSPPDIIIVDFIDTEKEEDRRTFLVHLVEIVLRDPVKTTVVDMIALSLAELTRKKVRKPFHKQA